MTLKECYAEFDGDYVGVIERLQREAMVTRFVKMFSEENLCVELCGAVEAGDVERAFCIAHTLKGNCLNLGFTCLLKAAEAMTEALRGGRLEEARQILGVLTKEYQRTVDAIRKLVP